LEDGIHLKDILDREDDQTFLRCHYGRRRLQTLTKIDNAFILKTFSPKMEFTKKTFVKMLKHLIVSVY
jgi:hypothetical protein